MGWIRVTLNRPCPICGAPKWCSVSEDKQLCYCMHVESDWKHKAGGFIHKLTPDIRQRIKNVFTRARKTESKKPPSYWHKVVMDAIERPDTETKLKEFAERLGLSINSLARLMCGWNGKAYTFPMWNGFGALCGVRTYYMNGEKRSVKGSRNGLFFPLEVYKYDDSFLFICEGPSDTASMLDLGFNAIGRPDAMSGVQHLGDFLACSRREVSIVVDRDRPGIRGLKRAIDVIHPYAKSIKLLIPPAGYKDIRAWYNAGCKRDDILKYLEMH